MSSSVFTLSALPVALTWHVLAPSWRVTNDVLCFTSGPNSDFFSDPRTGHVRASAACALMQPQDETFILSARASVCDVSTFDAAVLFVYVADNCWAKLCVERSPAGEPMVVSVVTRGISDDCNSLVLPSSAAYLRVAKTKNSLAFHYSLDGLWWHMVRYFSLGDDPALRVGFLAQSPMGQGCEATFSSVTYRCGVLADLRDGR